MAYSEDLRYRVVEFVVKDKGGKTEASRRFKVGRATVNRWLNLETLKPGKPGPKGPRRVNREDLRKAIESNPDSYISELAEQLKVSPSAIRHNLKQMKLSRKKNHAIQRTKRRRTQQVPAGNRKTEPC